MRMINKEAEECDFISKASEKSLKAKICENYLTPKAEVVLLKRGKDSLSCFYINRYGLGDVATDYLFTTNNKRLLFALIKKFNCNFSMVSKLIRSCKYEVVDEFFEIHNVVKYPEYSDTEFDLTSAESIIDYLKNKGMSAVALTLAIRTKYPDVIEFICENAKFSAAVGQKGAFENGKALLTKSQLEAIARVADKNSFEKLLKVYSYKTYKFLREIYMFRFGELIEGKAFISHHLSFTKEGKAAFFECADPELIADYCLRHGIEDWDADLIGNARVNDIIGLLKKMWIGKRAEKVLIERNNEDEIAAYIENHYFGYEEVAFIKKCSHELVMKYVEKHSLSETALIELFKRGNIVELFAYVIRHKLSDKAEFILSEIESDLLYDAYFFKEE